MPKFRKKPVEIEARQWNGDNAVELLDWIGDGLAGPAKQGGSSLFIPTLEGVHEASLGDWIIRGVQGEHYPCKPDIFEDTYDAIEGKAVTKAGERLIAAVRSAEEEIEMLASEDMELVKWGGQWSYRIRGSGVPVFIFNGGVTEPVAREIAESFRAAYNKAYHAGRKVMQANIRTVLGI